MASSFISALGGLRAHQSWIDVIGNNLANQNTPGFKSSRALFSDLLNITFRPGTGPGGTIGGTNPLQVGLGVQLASVDRQYQQGSLDATGRTFDLAMLGRGFFTLDNGVQTLYSRVGAFGLDADGNMVDLRSGYNVLDPTGAAIRLDSGDSLPARPTSEVRFSGNLPAEIGGPLAEILTSSSAFGTGTAAQMNGALSGPFSIPDGETWTMEIVANGGAPQTVSIAGSAAALSSQDVVDAINDQTEDVVASVDGTGAVQIVSERTGTRSTIKLNAGETDKDLKELLGLGDFVQGTSDPADGATDLNALTSNVTDYEVGDLIEFSGTDVDGAAVFGTFEYGVDGTSVAELVAAMDDAFGQSTVSFDEGTGLIKVTSDTTGEAQLSLTLTDAANQAGRSDWTSNFFAVTTNGTGPDKVTTSAEVFDRSGISHILTFDYARQDDGRWNVSFSLPDGESQDIMNLEFAPDGALLSPTRVTIEADLGSGLQDITLNLGEANEFSGLTQFGNPASVLVESQDGYAAGELSNFDVQKDGSIEAFYTNGQTQTVGNFGIATFANQEGLEEVGDSYFRTTANTGTRLLATGDANGAGEVIGGALETSNVDTAEEFVRMIQAQRGFQANARVITVQDELLTEVVNII